MATKYFIISGKSPLLNTALNDVETHVNDAISEGWVCHGGVSICHADQQFIVCQAMLVEFIDESHPNSEVLERLGIT